MQKVFDIRQGQGVLIDLSVVDRHVQELKQEHSAELQKAQLEQAPSQADCVGSAYKLPLVDTLKTGFGRG